MSKGEDFGKPGIKIRKGLYILIRILKSFDSAAYYIIWLKFLQVLNIPVDYFFYLLEKVTRKRGLNRQFPIVFVVGIQRTGSTLVSQFIEKSFDFFPVGNFNSIFHRSSYYLHKWFSNGYNGAHASYKNFYGISKGFYSIGDCYELWDKWFGENHYVIPDYISEEKQKNLWQYFASLHKAYQKPLLTKNNRNSLLLPIFQKNFKDVFFVIVKRDPIAVIRSTLKASKDFFGDEKFLWGLYPSKDFDTSDYENIVEAATVQYLMLDKILNQQIKNLTDDSFLIIDYNDFCKNPVDFQKKLLNQLNIKGISVNEVQISTEAFKISERLTNQDLDKQIEYFLRKWENNVP